jgi:hypothetical protein
MQLKPINQQVDFGFSILFGLFLYSYNETKPALE